MFHIGVKPAVYCAWKQSEYYKANMTAAAIELNPKVDYRITTCIFLLGKLLFSVTLTDFLHYRFHFSSARNSAFLNNRVILKHNIVYSSLLDLEGLIIIIS